MAIKTGQVSSGKIEKAGCGIRYSPDELTDDTVFDFSEAVALKALLESSRANDGEGDAVKVLCDSE